MSVFDIKNEKEEMKTKVVGILSRICDVIRLDSIGNKYIKGVLEVTDGAEEIIENRSKWLMTR